MRLETVVILLATACAGSSLADKTELTESAFDVPPGPVKIDKNLRRALLKALSDLDAESAEQQKDSENLELLDGSTSLKRDDIAKKDLNKNIAIVSKSTFSFNDFPSDEETPNEDKLQNSSFVEIKKQIGVIPVTSASMTIEKASKDDTRSFHVHNVLLSNRSSKPSQKSGSKVDQAKVKNSKTVAESFPVNKVESITLQPFTQISESLVGSGSRGIASVNSLTSPRPTISSPTVPTPLNSPASNASREKSEEVKIFQAPLVAAFTVQQDERGIPKSVVPIYRQTGDGQALTLQEQLEFKQKLLERQLAELHQQQIQQTQFLVRQQQLYEQQLRQKQLHQYYLQEQARLKQVQDQNRQKQFEEQQRLKQLEDQRLYHLQQQQYFPQQHKQRLFDQANKVAPFQLPHETQNVRFQSSIALDLPNLTAPPTFQTNFQEQTRPQQQRQPDPQQQKLQQSFGNFQSNFQPPVTSATRFHRQEALNTVGNFGINFDNKPTATKNAFNFDLPTRNPQNFVYNPYVQYRQQQSPAQQTSPSVHFHQQQSLPQQSFANIPFRQPQSLPQTFSNVQFSQQQSPPQQSLSSLPLRAPTPANQIQHLLYQSGIAGDLGSAQGSGGQEDLNILSKVLALNVGAVSNNIQYPSNSQNNSPFGKIPNNV